MPIYVALQDGSVHAIYYEVLWRKNDTALPVEYISTPIQNRGTVVGAVVIFTGRIKCQVAREALQVFAQNPRAAAEFSEWCALQRKRSR